MSNLENSSNETLGNCELFFENCSTDEQIFINNFVSKIKNLDDENILNIFNEKINSSEELFENLYEYMKDTINFKKKSLIYINNNYINQIKEKDNYIKELETRINKLNTLLDEQENRASERLSPRNDISKDYEWAKIELEKKNITINDLKRNLRNQIFLNDDKEYIILDLEKDIQNLKKQNFYMSGEIKSLKEELNNKMIEWLEQQEVLEFKNKELTSSMVSLQKENITINNNLSECIDELKCILNDLYYFKQQCIKENNKKTKIEESIIEDYL